MVHFLPMAQLVDDYAVYHFGRSQHQQTVDVEITLGRAAPPAGALVADCYAAEVDADQWSVVANSLGDIL